MSFIDYGLDIFTFGPRHRQAALKSCGDCPQLDYYKGLKLNQWESSCQHVIIEHLIDLGTYTEHELALVRAELDKYRSLKLTDEQIEQLGNFQIGDYDTEELERFVRISKFDYSSRTLNAEDHKDANSMCTSIDFDRTTWNVPGISLTVTKNDLNISSPRQDRGVECTCCDGQSSPGSTTQRSEIRTPLSHRNLRTTIIQKDSEIISLKHANAAKEVELKELEEQNQKLELIIAKMKVDLEFLESSSRISESQIEDIIRQKNVELEFCKENLERLDQELNEERHFRAQDTLEITKLQTLLREAQTYRKNLTEELQVTKRRIEALEASNATQASVIKQLQIERDRLDKQNNDQEIEIEKLLNIIKRLNEKYDKSKVELQNSRIELEARELKVAQCRQQLETMEREVSRLITDLADCLGRTNHCYHVSSLDQARELARDLNRIVREHDKCQASRDDLLREIERLAAINRANGIARPLGEIEEIKYDANKEIARLKRIMMGADNYKAIKMDLKSIVDDLVMQIDKRRIEKAEHTYLEVASEASLALEKLDKKINDHDVYRRCESFLLLELENLQEALYGAEKTINGNINSSTQMLELNDISNNGEVNRKLTGNIDYSILESVLSKKILQRVQNSTQIVVRITTALREDTILKMTYNKNLENQLQQSLVALNQMGAEKCKLESEYSECQEKSRELASEVEKLKALLNDKSSELQSLSNNIQSSIEFHRQENENLRKQLTIAENKFIESRSENTALIKKSDEMIETLQKELHKKELKLQEHGEFNDFLNSKLNESNRMIEKLQSAIVQESMRKVDLDSFTALHNRIQDLVKEKDELIERIAILESQLSSYERSNSKMQNSLAKISEDNEMLEKCIEKFRDENNRLESNLAKRDHERTDLGTMCDQLIGRIEMIVKRSKQHKKHMNLNVDDSALRALEKEIKNQKDKIRYQEKELLLKEKEIQDKNKKIEYLSSAINKAKSDGTNESLATLMKRVETLNREKTELKNELKQTLMKYEDKLAEMHKQYKHNEIELHKNHNESIMHLEAKYMEMMKEEGKVFSSQHWLQSLTESELQELHDRICKTPLCANSTYEHQLYEEQKKKSISNKSAVSKKPLQPKKDVRNMKSASQKPGSRQRIMSARETLSNDSMAIPEKEYSLGISTARNKH